MTITKEGLLALPYDGGEVYAIGTTPDGELLAVQTAETADDRQVLVVVAGSLADLVPLDSLVRFQVPIEFYDEPRRWEGKI